LSKIYGEAETEVRALDNVSFSVKKGEFVLVIGSSGSGKSTLLNMIGLLDRPTEGRVRPTEGRVLVDGFDTSDLTDNEISAFRNKKLGFVFQFANLLADLTVLENVLLPSQIQFDSTTYNKAKEILEKVGLKDQLFKRANKISGGQAQRAAIARGLVNNPTIVLADEPTGNLDSVTARNIVQLMKNMAKDLGQTFIVVTHERAQFGDVDRIVTIKDGRAFEGEQMDPMEVAV
jgi:lipoprotein-releasing system ATP-binding protein